MASTEDVPQLLEKLNSTLSNLSGYGLSEDLRVQAIQCARNISIALEKPEDALLKLTFSVGRPNSLS